ncbi:MAG: hypothetical protein ACJAVT_001262 [Yoonia sp.]|jgi:hypothetical protein
MLMPNIGQMLYVAAKATDVILGGINAELVDEKPI